MPVDPLYSESTNEFLVGQNQANVQAPIPPSPSTSIGSIARATGRGLGQGGAQLVGGAADLGVGLSQLYSDPDVGVGNPDAQAAQDKRVNDAMAASRAGHLFESQVGTAAYDLADTLKPDPTKTTATDQVVQGAVSSLAQIVPAAVVGGPIAGAAVGGAAIGLSHAEDLKRQGVDVGTRTALGTLEGGLGAAGAVLPVGGSTLARTAAMVAVGGPGFSIAQGLAEKAILRNANYDHLADQINPLDPTSLAASTIVAGLFGSVHLVGARRAAANVDATVAAPAVPAAGALDAMSVEQRKALPYNAPQLDAYATQAAQAAGVPPDMVLFLKNQGERSNSNEVSPTGARGVMQFEPATWQQYGHGDPTDPVNSINAAVAYSKDLLTRYDGDKRAAVTEYNGGIEQARAVQAGGAPTDPETQAYLGRYDQFAANHEISNATFSPTPVQTDAALMSTGQQMVDAAHIGPADDVASMAVHQDAVQLAAQQMDAGQMPDVSSVIPPELMRAEALSPFARDIGESISNTPEPLPLPQAGVSTASAFNAQRQEIMRNPVELVRNRSGDADYAKTEAKLPPVPDGHIRLYRGGAESANAFKDTFRESGIEDHHSDLPGVSYTPILKVADYFRASYGRDATVHYVDVPTKLAERGKLDDTEYKLDVDALNKQVANEAAAPATDVVASASDAQPLDDVNAKLADAATGDATAQQAKPQSAVEQNVRHAAEEQPDILAHLDSNDGEITGKLSDLVQKIDDEHQATLDDAKLFSVAANCFITGL